MVMIFSILDLCLMKVLEDIGRGKTGHAMDCMSSDDVSIYQLSPTKEAVVVVVGQEDGGH